MAELDFRTRIEQAELRRQEPAWWAAAINRRATVEQWMFDAARGKRPMPTPEELRAWATKLGTPSAGEPLGEGWPNEIERAALRSLIADDAYAMTFQTCRQYRTALLKAIDAVATSGAGR